MLFLRVFFVSNFMYLLHNPLSSIFKKIPPNFLPKIQIYQTVYLTKSSKPFCDDLQVEFSIVILQGKIIIIIIITRIFPNFVTLINISGYNLNEITIYSLLLIRLKPTLNIWICFFSSL